MIDQPPAELYDLLDVTEPIPTPRRDQIGNAQRAWRTHRHGLRYVAPWGKWFEWSDAEGRWIEDSRDVRATERMKSVVQELWAEVPKLSPDDRRPLIRWAYRSATAASLRATLELLRGMPGIAISPDQLDADPDLLNTRNGILHLPSGELRPHDPALLQTRQTSTSYNPAALCPKWIAFLERCIPDAETRAFVQRAVGYTLNGRTTEHVMMLLLGEGANGKSTFASAVRSVFGSYAGVARKDLFVVTHRGQHDSSRVGLEGRRFIAASEIDAGSVLSEAEIKELSGGETITARRLYAEAHDVVPSWTIWLSTNYKPQVRGTDEAIWRRLCLIEWPVTIPEQERDAELGARLAAEAEGILVWAVEGHAQWCRIGLARPAAVVTATAAYRSSEDVVGRFLADGGLAVDPTDPTLTIANSTLGERFQTWCEESGERISRRRLVEDLKRRGAVSTRTSNSRGWRHLGVVMTPVTEGDGSPGGSSYVRTRSDFREKPS